MFKRISVRIALQFTGFVFLFMIVTGGVFLTASVASRRHESTMRLSRMIQLVLDNPQELATFPSMFPPFQRARVRILDMSGAALYSGQLYEDIPFDPKHEFFRIPVGEESYDVLTAPLMRNKQLLGYIQVADRSPPNDLMEELLMYLLVSACISALTFGVGLLFARTSLKPAEESMKRLEQFTQDASHELRTPLTAVNTSIDLALLGDDPKVHLKDAKHDLRQILTLIERLLELARLDRFALRSESVDFSSVVRESIERHAKIAGEKGITIDSSVADSVRVSGDPALIHLVLSNLLGNAIKFSKKDQSISVKLTKNSLKIQDFGIGISKEALPKIFDRFYQEDAARSGNQGLGLGLSLVKRIVDLHGWQIFAESKQGNGAQFTLKF